VQLQLTTLTACFFLYSRWLQHPACLQTMCCWRTWLLLLRHLPHLRRRSSILLRRQFPRLRSLSCSSYRISCRRFSRGSSGRISLSATCLLALSAMYAIRLRLQQGRPHTEASRPRRSCRASSSWHLRAPARQFWRGVSPLSSIPPASLLPCAQSRRTSSACQLSQCRATQAARWNGSLPMP